MTLPTTPSLKAFLSSVFSNLKSPKEQKLLQDLALMSLEKRLPDFVVFLSLLSPEQTALVLTEQVKSSIARKVAKEKEFTQEHYDLLTNNSLKLELKHLISIKKTQKFSSGINLLELALKDKSPKNERVEALYNLMADYKKAFDSNTSLSLTVIEKYKQKINPGNVEKEYKESNNFYWVNKFGIKVSPKSSSRHKQKEITSTRKVKTQDQKGFDQVYSVFIHFLAKHLREDFLAILDILDLDFLAAFKKISVFNPKESLDIWKDFTKRLDIKSYYDSLGEAQKQDMIKLFHRIKRSVEQIASENNKKFTYSQSINFTKKGTKENIQSILDYCFIMSAAGFTAGQIVDSFSIFETDLKKMYPSSLPINDFLFSFLPSQFKNLTKIEKETVQILITQFEKQALDTLLDVGSTNLTEKKISIKKYKI